MYTNIFLENTLLFSLEKTLNYLQLKIKYAEGTTPPMLRILEDKPGNLISDINSDF